MKMRTSKPSKPCRMNLIAKWAAGFGAMTLVAMFTVQTALAVPVPWAEKRVAESQTRLNGLGEVGQLVWKSIEQHGGLRDWFIKQHLEFAFDYQPVKGARRNTLQRVDNWSSLARHRLGDQPDLEFGWDGKQAWSTDPEKTKQLSPRFWALTPYYFVGIPFVLADPGVNLENLGELKLQGQSYKAVRVTFGEDVGDSPKDFYIVYFDGENRVKAARYIVTYPGFFPDGGQSPEKIVFYSDYESVEGIVLAKKLDFFAWDEKAAKPGKRAAVATVPSYQFRLATSKNYYTRPKNAEVLKGF